MLQELQQEEDNNSLDSCDDSLPSSCSSKAHDDANKARLEAKLKELEQEQKNLYVLKAARQAKTEGDTSGSRVPYCPPSAAVPNEADVTIPNEADGTHPIARLEAKLKQLEEEQKQLRAPKTAQSHTAGSHKGVNGSSQAGRAGKAGRDTIETKAEVAAEAETASTSPSADEACKTFTTPDGRQISQLEVVDAVMALGNAAFQPSAAPSAQDLYTVEHLLSVMNKLKQVWIPQYFQELQRVFEPIIQVAKDYPGAALGAVQWAASLAEHLLRAEEASSQEILPMLMKGLDDLTSHVVAKHSAAKEMLGMVRIVQDLLLSIANHSSNRKLDSSSEPLTAPTSEPLPTCDLSPSNQMPVTISEVSVATIPPSEISKAQRQTKKSRPGGLKKGFFGAVKEKDSKRKDVACTM